MVASRGDCSEGKIWMKGGATESCLEQLKAKTNSDSTWVKGYGCEAHREVVLAIPKPGGGRESVRADELN